MAKKNSIIKKITRNTKKNPIAAIGISAASGCIAALATDHCVRSIRAKRAEKKYQKQLAEQASKAAKVTNSPEVLEEVPTF
jgi:hypothetical protein